MADAIATAVLLERPTGPDLDMWIRAFLGSFSSPNTRRAYGHDLADWLTFCREWDADPLGCRRQHVDAYMEALDRRGLAAATRARRLTTLRAFYDYLIREELVERNPGAAVRTPRVVHEDQPYLDRVQIRLLLEAAEATTGYRLALVRLLFNCGLRISEVIGADVGDLGSERHHRTLKIQGKGDKPATIPLPPEVAMAIDQHLAEREVSPSDPLLVSDAGRRLHRQTAACQLKRLCKRAGIPEISPHALRHSVITILLLAGVPLRDVQLFARHSDPATTAKYDAAARSLDAHPSYSVARALV